MPVLLIRPFPTTSDNSGKSRLDTLHFGTAAAIPTRRTFGIVPQAIAQFPLAATSLNKSSIVVHACTSLPETCTL